MNLDIQFKIKNNNYYQKYIRENSHWYKILNREPELFKKFEEEVKDNYKLRPTDKINRVIEGIEFLQSILSVVK